MANKKDMEEELTSWGLGNLVAIIVLLIIVIMGGTLLGNYVVDKKSQKSIAGTEASFQPVVEKTISYDGQDGKTALELLKETRQVETQDSTFGTFISSIDGIQNQENKYWMFYVNDNLAPEGADTYKTKNGEKIEWRYETW